MPYFQAIKIMVIYIFSSTIYQYFGTTIVEILIFQDYHSNFFVFTMCFQSFQKYCNECSIVLVSVFLDLLKYIIAYFLENFLLTNTSVIIVNFHIVKSMPSSGFATKTSNNIAIIKYFLLKLSNLKITIP